jgi:hypothetical protein
MSKRQNTDSKRDIRIKKTLRRDIHYRNLMQEIWTLDI